MTKEKTSTGGQAKIHAILMNLSEDERKLLNAVIKVEGNKHNLHKPRTINDELWKALTEIIR